MQLSRIIALAAAVLVTLTSNISYAFETYESFKVTSAKYRALCASTVDIDKISCRTRWLADQVIEVLPPATLVGVVTSGNRVLDDQVIGGEVQTYYEDWIKKGAFPLLRQPPKTQAELLSVMDIAYKKARTDYLSVPGVGLPNYPTRANSFLNPSVYSGNDVSEIGLRGTIYGIILNNPTLTGYIDHRNMLLRQYHKIQ